MKSIIVKNVMIQFDSFDENADNSTAIQTIENINSVLQERFPDISPQIFTSAIDDSDIEIAEDENEEEF
jgi:hypothetical protein